MRRLIKGYPTILHGDNRNTQVRQPGITLYLFRHQPTTGTEHVQPVFKAVYLPNGHCALLALVHTVMLKNRHPREAEKYNKILQTTAQYYAGLTQL